MVSLVKKVAQACKNAYMDFKVGGQFLGGVIETPYSQLGAFNSANSTYGVVTDIFTNRVKVNKDDVLVDVGCAKGRVINAWLLLGLRNKIIGIELDDQIAARTKKRLERYKNVSIIAGNVLDNLPNDGTIYYLFNPFHDRVLKAFIDKLWEINTGRGKDVRIVYYNCAFLDVFKDDQRWVIEEEFDCPNLVAAHRGAIIRLAN
jgi:hypothetical protein